MYRMPLHNATLDCSPQGGSRSPEIVKPIDYLFESGECLHFIFQSKSGVVEDGTKHNDEQQTRTVITDWRLLIHTGEYADTNHWSIPYDEVESIDLHSGLVSSKLSVSTSSRTLHVRLPQEALNDDTIGRAVEFVEDRMEYAASLAPLEDSRFNDVPDETMRRLRHLKATKRAGDLTEREFERRKQWLLR